MMAKSAAENQVLQSYWGTVLFDVHFLPSLCPSSGKNCRSEVPVCVGVYGAGISAADRNEAIFVVGVGAG
jgi:hypothetical protein